MGTPLFQVDAFSAEPFAGNPAAVCLLDGAREAQWMQAVAAEMNLSETAFLWEEGRARRLRWFTPRVEVDLCGHATLAAAHVLFETGRASGEVRFSTRSGELCAAREGDWIELDFPTLEPRPEVAEPMLLEALGIAALEIRVVSTHRSRFDRLIELESEAAVRALAPDFRALAAVDARGVIVTAPGERHDFVSRFFAPAVGIDEDPVTGSAHCVLAPFWAARLGREELTGFQASHRGGLVRVRLAGGRVALGGQAVTVLAGELRI